MIVLEVIGLLLALVLSFYLMAKICDEYFIDSLDRIAKKSNMSSDAAGATLMAMGSSAPELFIAIIALIKAYIEPGVNNEAIGIGTIVGSAIFNVLVIIGAAALVRKALLAWQPIVRDLLFYSLSIVLMIIAFRDFKITLTEAMIFVGLYAVYVFAVVKWRKILPYEDEQSNVVETKTTEIDEYKGWKIILKPIDYALSKLFPQPKYYVWVFIVSIMLIAGLSWALVESAVEISNILQIPKAIVALTVLAVGTSVPDLISSVIVAKQGRGGMAISNAFGSNVFDILIGLGVPWVISLAISGGTVSVGAESLFISSIILFGSVIVLLMFLIFSRWRIGFASGLFFIGLYILYVIWEITKDFWLH